MRKYLRWQVIGLLALALSSVWLPLNAMADLASDEEDAEVVLTLVNIERERAGCGPVRLDTRLNRAAEAHARAMAEDNFFAHEDPKGRKPSDRVRAQGYTYIMVGENIAAGRNSAESVMDGWMHSPGHRTNILTCGYQDMGVGHVFQRDDKPLKGADYPLKHYWVQVFGRQMTR
jgi:uncharacterized protein YkwD